MIRVLALRRDLISLHQRASTYDVQGEEEEEEESNIKINTAAHFTN